MKRLKTTGRARTAAVAAAVLAVGVFASLGGVGYAAGLVHFAQSSPTAAQYPPSKVTICHHTHSQKNPFVTITVSVHALPAHLGHGDTIGPCPQAASIVTPSKLHTAHGSGHGHNGNKHNVNGAGASVEPSSAASNHGQGNRSKGHSSTGAGQVHGKGHGNAKGHDTVHGHGHGHGQGQGNGHGHGPGGTHGNSGGGKGNGH